MKKKILLFTASLLIVCFLQSSAQITKGSVFLGGQIGFNSQTTTSTIVGMSPQKNNGFYISPAIGFAMKDNLVIGFDVTYSHSYNTNNSINYPYDQTNNMFGAGVFLRRYIPLGKGFYVFGQGRLGGSSNTGKINQNAVNLSDDIKGYSFDLGFYPGISYQISKRLQLETGFNNLFDISYQHSTDTQANTYSSDVTKSTTNSFSASTSISNLASFTLGLRLLLTK